MESFKLTEDENIFNFRNYESYFYVKCSLEDFKANVAKIKSGVGEEFFRKNPNQSATFDVAVGNLSAKLPSGVLSLENEVNFELVGLVKEQIAKFDSLSFEELDFEKNKALVAEMMMVGDDDLEGVVGSLFLVETTPFIITNNMCLISSDCVDGLVVSEDGVVKFKGVPRSILLNTKNTEGVLQHLNMAFNSLIYLQCF